MDVTDQAGNVTLTEFYFRMQAISPPAFLTNCGTGDLEGKSLEANNLSSWFLDWQPSFFNGKLQFAHLPQGTMAPWRYEFSLADVEAHIEETVELVVDVRAEHELRFAECEAFGTAAGVFT